MLSLTGWHGRGMRLLKFSNLPEIEKEKIWFQAIVGTLFVAVSSIFPLLIFQQKAHFDLKFERKKNALVLSQETYGLFQEYLSIESKFNKDEETYRNFFERLPESSLKAKFKNDVDSLRSQRDEIFQKFNIKYETLRGYVTFSDSKQLDTQILEIIRIHQLAQKHSLPEIKTTPEEDKAYEESLKKYSDLENGLRDGLAYILKDVDTRLD